MPRNYWMVVTTLENYRITRGHDCTVQGFKGKLRKRVEGMEVGDRMLFYIGREKWFAASATVTSTFFEEHNQVWVSPSGREEYPYRVHIEPEALLEEEEFLDAREIGPRMEYVKKWTPERWPLAFIGDLHLVPKKDFSLIEDEMKKVISSRRRSAGASNVVQAEEAPDSE